MVIISILRKILVAPVGNGEKNVRDHAGSKTPIREVLPKYVEQNVPNAPGGGRLCKIRTRSYLSVCFSFRVKQSVSTIDLIDNLQ